MSDQQNLFLAVILSIIVLVGYDYFFVAPDREAFQQRQAVEAALNPAGLPGAPVPTSQGSPAAFDSPPMPTSTTPAPGPQAGVGAAGLTTAPRERGDVLSDTRRARIETKRLRGSISLKGGRIDDIVLADYRESLEPDSPNIVLFSPPGSEHPYYADFGWAAAPGAGLTLPDGATEWQTVGRSLSFGSPLVLTWDNGGGLRFTRTYAVDENFLFTVTQRVDNTGTRPVTLYPYGLISRMGKPDVAGFYILHEGALGVFDGTLSEMDYDELREEGRVQSKSTGGWIGITDKYWLAALAPEQNSAFSATMSHTLSGQADRYQVDFLMDDGLVVAPGAGTQVSSMLFVGAKEVELLDRYEKGRGIARFDLAIDWGWFYFLTKPLFYLLDYLFALLGNFGVAILALTVVIKLMFFPLANKSYVAMSKMKKLQPEIVKVRERFKDDKMRQQQELMAIYKKEQVNPMAGCLPILIQIPVFFALYKVLFVTIEMRQSPFFGWIQDLSAPDPMTVFNLFGLIPWDPPAMLAVGIWPVLMGASMFLQQKLNPQPPDPIQAKVFMIMPFMFTFLLASFPAGLVIYWTWNNILSITQQWVIMRRMGVKI